MFIVMRAGEEGEGGGGGGGARNEWPWMTLFCVCVYVCVCVCRCLRSRLDRHSYVLGRPKTSPYKGISRHI